MISKKCAFFDVDETIINFNSLQHFLEYFLINYFGFEEAQRKLKYYKTKVARLGPISRNTLNQLYYENYGGVELGVVKEIGINWFNEVIKNQIFNHNVLKRLKHHISLDDKVVFVSGGFFATLDPLANYLGIKDVLCTTNLLDGSYLNGKIDMDNQIIGEGKAVGIKKYVANSKVNIDLAQCYAYGDHISDSNMLLSVGNPVVVGNNIELLKLAINNNWERIS